MNRYGEYGWKSADEEREGDRERQKNYETVESLFVKWTIQPSLSTFEPLLLVCFTLWTILIKGMLLEESISL